MYKFTTDDGLPQNSIYSLYQDSKGYLWIGTEAGLSKYDGETFRNYSVVSGLVYNHVRTIYEDSSGKLWFGTNQGISVLDGNEFTNYTKEDGLTDEFIYAIAEANPGEYWITTGFGGLNKFENGSFTSITSKNKLPTDSLRAFLNAENKLWIGTLGYGIVTIEDEDYNYYHTRNVRGLANDTVTAIYKDSRNYIWIGTQNGLSRYDGKRFTNFTNRHPALRDKIFTILEDQYNNLWIGTSSNGLLFYDGENFTQHISTNLGLAGNTIYCALENQRGDIWFGTGGGGLNQLPAERFLIFDTENSIPSNEVYGVLEDSYHNIWVGLFGEGICKITKNGVQILTSKDGLFGDQVAVIIEDKYKDIWAGGFGGISKIGRDGIVSFNNDTGIPDPVLSMAEDENGIWLGTGGGVVYFDFRTQNISPIDEINNYIGEGWIYKVFVDSKNNVWIGSEIAGAIKYSDNIEIFDKEKGLITNSVMDITEDPQGNIWLSTEGGGVSKLDQTGAITNITRADGLPGNTVYWAEVYDKYIYFGTNQGLARFEYDAFDSLKASAFRVYNTADRLPATEMNMGSVFLSKNGVLYFGSHNGLTRFDLRYQPNSVAAKTYLNNIKIIDDETEIDTLPSEFTDFSYTENNMRFIFNAVSFTSRSRLVYQHRLVGIENNWINGNEKNAAYPFIPSGSFTFEVRTKNDDGIWSEPASFNFRINPPFWQTWWFITVIILIGISLTYLLYLIKTAQVRRRNIELANMVKDRTRELELEKDKTDELIHNILPSTTVAELKSKGFVEPRLFKNVTILFTDFKGFTSSASEKPPGELVNELNEIFLAFDKIVEDYQLEKLKTIGDAYMAACGLPEENFDHAIRVVYAALKMQEFMKTRREKSTFKWEMRAGVHTGQVIAGVVGSKKFTYDIWGDTVNTASRMESSGIPGEVNISAATYESVKDYYEFEYRGKIDAKGKGKMDMHLVKGVKEKVYEVVASNELV
ncbi:MAG: hypothetical protein K9J16_15250 [Melioribacteraceae bacterium]|nr:hypothetical protein [Melioribacteraceae bacterium]MCF8353060.1 hypothetical protein [Melioribacteraceae bacterium]MCF8392794.1 hypothetical protein [Melioribacteraceae bacterium]MCF8418325.1 hypothetical protein [Melioribacteraceae bacterium]